MNLHGTRRSAQVLVLALVGCLCGIPLGKGLAGAVASADSFGGSALAAGHWLAYLGVTSALIAATVILRPRWSHLVHSLYYPSTLLAVPLGCTLPWVVVKASGPQVFGLPAGEAGAVALAGLGYLATVACVIGWRDRRPEGTPRTLSAPDSGGLAKPAAELGLWLRNEAPISSANEDLLNYSHRAERIVRALETERIPGSRLMQTVVVRGPFGSGKSSLISLVKEKAEGRRLLFVEVSCWGFESSARAREYVVEQCVDALAEVVDCTSIRGLPRHYIGALGAAGTWGASMASLFSYARTPREQLARFEPILAAIGWQLVVVIEDTDRNGADFDPADVESMLHDFRSAARLSFILTVGEARGLEYPKVAEAIEFLPYLQRDMTLRMLDEVRTELRGGPPYLDPAEWGANSNHHRPKSLRLDVEDSVQVTRFMHGYLEWPAAVARLLSTPRRLKSLLNALRRDWPNLRGEVDIDVWIIVTALRHSAPGAFTFLGTQLRELRIAGVAGWGNTEDAKKAHEAQVAKLRGAWEKACERTDFDRDAAEILLLELVPGTRDVFPGKRNYAPNRLQGIHRPEGPDYWSRMVAGTSDAGDVRDQHVLALLAAAKEDDPHLHELAGKAVESPTFSDRLLFFEDYLHVLPVKRRLQLLSAPHDAVLRRDGRQASTDSRGFAELHSGLVRTDSEDDVLWPWLERETMRAAEISLKLANDLVRSHTRHRPFIAVLRRSYVRKIQARFATATVGELAQRLDASYPYSLYHLVYFNGEEDKEDLLTRPQDWAPLAGCLLGEMGAAPAEIVPQVLRLIGDTVPPHPDFPKYFRFDEKKLRGIFGERAVEALATIAQTKPVFPQLSQWEALRTELGVKEAATLQFTAATAKA